VVYLNENLAAAAAFLPHLSEHHTEPENMLARRIFKRNGEMLLPSGFMIHKAKEAL
jgi:hypothetical protein